MISVIFIILHDCISGFKWLVDRKHNVEESSVTNPQTAFITVEMCLCHYFIILYRAIIVIWTSDAAKKLLGYAGIWFANAMQSNLVGTNEKGRQCHPHCFLLRAYCLHYANYSASRTLANSTRLNYIVLMMLHQSEYLNNRRPNPLSSIAA